MRRIGDLVGCGVFSAGGIGVDAEEEPSVGPELASVATDLRAATERRSRSATSTIMTPRRSVATFEIPWGLPRGCFIEGVLRDC